MNNYIEILSKIGNKISRKQGSILFYEGDTPTRLYVLLEGVVRLYKSDASGNEITIHRLQPQSFIAEMPLFEGLAYPASAVFQTDGVVLSVDFARFCDELIKSPELNLALIASLMGKIRVLEKRIARDMLLDLRSRLAHYLIEHAAALASTTQRTIAQDLNVTPQSLSRILRELKDEGYISVEKGKIRVQEPRKLAEILG